MVSLHYEFINAHHATASTLNNIIRQYLIQGKHHTSITPCLSAKTLTL